MAVLVDTGPLVAILRAEDQYHELCVRTLTQLRDPLLSCWPVITEAAWLLRGHPRALEKLLLGSAGSFLELSHLSGAEAIPIAEILNRYAGLRPQLADASLVYLAERENINTIFTLDRRDFSVYRTAHKRAFRIIPE
ncbi:MAG: PIN domain-containing protein [Candidatus Acidiferrum sp.]